jgi:apolipoprotein D and lipocalin family protein
MQKRMATVTAVLALLLAGVGNVHAQQVTAIPKLDEMSLAGAWYEVARIPTKHESKRCKSDIVEVIAPGERNQLQLVDSCTNPKGYTDATNRTARQDKAKDGKLKITTIFPFSTKYWVIAQGAQDEWFLVGNPNRKALWIFSKTPTLPPATLLQIESQAAAQSFQVSKLVPVSQ